MTDQPWYSPNRQPAAPRAPKPRELLYEFTRDADRAHFRCELLDYGGYGVEAQISMDGSPLIARRFETRALAVQWATTETGADTMSNERQTSTAPGFTG